MEEALAESASGLPRGDEDEEMAEVTALVLRPLKEPGGNGGQEGGVPVEGMVFQHGRRSAEVSEDCLQLGSGFAVVLLDGELEGGFEDGSSSRGLPVLEEGFAEENAGEHPVVAGCGATFEVRDGVNCAAFLGEGLREAKAEEHVFGLGFNLG